jgi:hypothetical protein
MGELVTGSFQGHASPVSLVEFSLNGELIISSSDDFIV